MSSTKDGGNGPLEGLRVIDWTMWQFGPISTVMLADMGAEVINVESLDGDHGQQFGQMSRLNTDLADGVNAYFEKMNRQKLGIALDLKNQRGVEIIHQLVARSDIFVEKLPQRCCRAARLRLRRPGQVQREVDLCISLWLRPQGPRLWKTCIGAGR